MKLRAHFGLLVLGALLPMVAFSAVMLVWAHRQTRQATARGLVDTARAISVAVDREIGATVAALRLLGASEHLRRGDLLAFYDAARDAVRTQPAWQNVVLYAVSGQPLVNTLRPRGAPIPNTGHVEPVKRALQEKNAAVSDVFVGLLTGQPLVSVVVPVVQDGAPNYALAAILPAATVLQALRAHKIPSDWVATIIDRNGIIIARTRPMDEWLGKPATPKFVERSRREDAASFRDVTKDGVPVYAAYSRSSLSGWTVGLGAPVAAVDAPWRVSLLAISGAAVFCLLVGGGLAVVFARRIAAAIRGLSVSARALAQGEVPPESGGSPIAEIQAVEQELVATARERADAVAARLQTEEALRESQERTRLTVAHALDAVITIDAEGYIT